MQEEKGKCIVVDGSSLFAMGIANGIGGIRQFELYGALTELGKSTVLSRIPAYITSARASLGLRNAISHAGFDLLVETTEGSADDKAVRNIIQEQNPDKTAEIILVSADIKDYLSILLEKSEAGIEIYIVATKATGHDDHPMVSPQVMYLFQEESKFHFIEIGEYKSRIMYREAEEGFSTRGIQRYNFLFEFPNNEPRFRSKT